MVGRSRTSVPQQLRLTITPQRAGGHASYQLSALTWSQGGRVPTASAVASGAVLMPEGWSEDQLIQAMALILNDLTGALG